MATKSNVASTKSNVDSTMLPVALTVAGVDGALISGKILILINCYCLREQRKVTRLPAPYGNCHDPDSIDSSKNAYSDFYPVKYTSPVRLSYSFILVDEARLICLIFRSVDLTFFFVACSNFLKLLKLTDLDGHRIQKILEIEKHFFVIFNVYHSEDFKDYMCCASYVLSKDVIHCLVLSLSGV